MAKSIWKGAISFGLVHIPVEIVTAVTEQRLSLSMVDKRDFAPIGFRRYNKHSGEEVSWDNIVKAYEVADEDFVVLSDEDLRQANVEATQTIDIQAFVEAGDISLLYYDTPYYLVPGKGGDKVYALLRETLKRAGKVAIATVVIRVRQHLAALVCVDDAIALITLRYQDELRMPDQLDLATPQGKRAAVSAREVEMALNLVESMAEPWQPERYHDSYRDDILTLVEKKVKAGQTRTITEPAPSKAAPADNVVDLVSLLERSLGSKKTTQRAKSGSKTRPADSPRQPRTASGQRGNRA